MDAAAYQGEWPLGRLAGLVKEFWAKIFQWLGVSKDKSLTVDRFVGRGND
jgi:hypothetical protein